MADKPAIGFAGLGAMGFGMATHLIKQGYPVTGFDVWAPTLEKFSAQGGTPSSSLSGSAKGKLFYVVMVATAQQAQQALFGAEDSIVSSLPQGATLILCSTVPSSYAKEVAAELKEKGRGDIHFIDAPVSGGAIRAADGTLSIMAGAENEAIEKGQWLLEEMSAPTKLFIVKGGIGAGSNMKMVHQVLAAIQILSTSEAYGFAARLGLNGKDVKERIVGDKSWSWMFENRSLRTLTEDYFPGASAVGIIMKDTVRPNIFYSRTRKLTLKRASSHPWLASSTSQAPSSPSLSRSTSLPQTAAGLPTMTPVSSASGLPILFPASRVLLPQKRRMLSLTSSSTSSLPSTSFPQSRVWHLPSTLAFPCSSCTNWPSRLLAEAPCSRSSVLS